jgi:hypothetical protein
MRVEIGASRTTRRGRADRAPTHRSRRPRRSAHPHPITGSTVERVPFPVQRMERRPHAPGG